MRFLKELYAMMQEKKYSTLSGSMAFFILINGGATMFLIILISSRFDVDLYLLFVNFDYLPEPIKNLLEYIISTSRTFSNGYSMIFLFSSIWGSSNLFYQLLQTGELIFGKSVSFSNLLRRTLSLIIMALFLFVLIISIISIIVINYLITNINFQFFNLIWNIICFLIIPIILLTFINLYIPPIKIKFRGAFLGSLFTTIFWLTSSSIFTIYLKYFSNFKVIYGALTFIIVFMFWIYLLTNGLIIGFVINYKYQILQQIKMTNMTDNMIGD